MDYYAFCRMLLDGGIFRGSRILGRKSIELMTTNQLRSILLRPEGGFASPGYGYGFGVQVLLDLGECQTLGPVGEYNWGGAANTDIWIDPREQMIGIQLSQFMPDGFHRVGQDFRVSAYQAIDD
jgi:CubicO group peptidase (beta-lactamase class C family)